MNADLSALKDMYFDLLDAWNRRNAADYARLFAPSAIMVGFDGSSVGGRAEIEAHLSPIFSDHPTARYVAKIRDVRELGGNCALLNGVAGMVAPGKNHIMPDRNAVQTIIGSRTLDGGWQIELFQNTPARFDGRPEEAEKLTAELQQKFEAAA